MPADWALTNRAQRNTQASRRDHFMQGPAGNQLSELVFCCQNMNGSGKRGKAPAILVAGEALPERRL